MSKELWQLLALYLAAVNLAAFALMGADKRGPGGAAGAFRKRPCSSPPCLGAHWAGCWGCGCSATRPGTGTFNLDFRSCFCSRPGRCACYGGISACELGGPSHPPPHAHEAPPYASGRAAAAKAACRSSSRPPEQTPEKRTLFRPPRYSPALDTWHWPGRCLHRCQAGSLSFPDGVPPPRRRRPAPAPFRVLSTPGGCTAYE